jgi:3-oxoacyl-[acyl-carrier protein] reductase
VAFGAEGATVGIGYRTRRTDADTVLEKVRAAGGNGEVLQVDVRDMKNVRAVVDGFAAAHGLHVVVNSAAVVMDQFVAMMDDAAWSDTIAVNLTGTYHVCRAALPHLMRAHGTVVNVASIAGFRASPGQANYSAAKGGVVALTATLGAELAPRGVRVNAVVPGLLSVGMGQRLDQRVVEQRLAHIPLRRLGTGDEVARVVLFLASDESAYVVGQCVVVDGGLSL